MRANRFIVLATAIFSFAAFSGETHKLARLGKWADVRALVEKGASLYEADVDGSTLQSIAQSRGQLNEYTLLLPYAQPYSPAYQPPPLAMYDAPRAPPQENPQAAALQEQLADQLFEYFEHYRAKIISFENEVERVRFIEGHRENLKNSALQLREHLRRAFEFRGRTAEVMGTILLSDFKWQADNSRTWQEVDQAGECEPTRCKTCTTGSCWAKSAIQGMHCNSEEQRYAFCCWDSCTPCQITYCSTFGLYGVTGIAQAASAVACLPFYYCPSASTYKTAVLVDPTLDTNLEKFIAEMRVFRKALKEPAAL
jgi:hypothetical protein